MDKEPRTLRGTFVEAYPRYVAQLLTGRGVQMVEVVADAVVDGTSVLDGLLMTLEATPFPMQRQSPLELFREALRPVGRALDTVGMQPPEVPSGSTFTAWDTYGLSPASSAELGPEAHEAHLRWGVSKARAMSAPPSPPQRPSIAVWCSAQDRRTIEEQVVSAGYVVSDWHGQASLAVVDVDADMFEDDLAVAMEAAGRTIVFGSAIDDIQQTALRARGVWKIVDRQQILSDLSTVVPSLV
jgi:hypothetical protein